MIMIYMNVVGYKEGLDENVDNIQAWIYMNVVGYKARRSPRVLYTRYTDLYERSGI